MADLKFIMDMNDGEPTSLVNKRDVAPLPPGANRGQDASASERGNPGDHSDDNRPTPATTSKRCGHSGRQFKSSAGTTSSSAAATTTTTTKPTSPSSTASTARPAPDRQPSNTSTEEMDPGYGGHGGSGSSSNTPMRPIGSPSGGELPIKLTPITGRVSRAKKGVPVHTCETCRPPKTFTRAEHLRRHQLSHQTPGFPCTYPGCGRAFHRADLLARHAARHEQEGEKTSSVGSGSRRTSVTSTDDGSVPRTKYIQHVPSSMGGSITSRGSVSGPSSEMNPGYGGGSTTYPPMGMQGSGGSTPMSPPQPQGRGDSYQLASSGPSQGNYTLSTQSQIPLISNQPPSLDNSPTAGNYSLGFQSPRTSSSFPHYVVTGGLQPHLPSLTIPDSNPPGLLAAHEISPWASSDSNFSTPSEVSHGRSWVRSFNSPTSDWPGTSLVTTYHQQSGASQDLQNPGTGLEGLTSATPFMVNAFSPTMHKSGFNPILDMPLSFSEENALLDHSSHPRHDAYNLVRSPTPPTASSSVQSAETLVSLAPALPDTTAMVGRYKDSAVLMGTLSNASFLTAHSLRRPVRNAIPDLIDVYWRRFDTLFPLIHRWSFGTAPTEVLRCAMAAMATQFLDGEEDRNKGTELHEFASQEAKRSPQWNVQIMQAILLCEFFARFRGKEASTRPSQPFQSIYARVANPPNPGDATTTTPTTTIPTNPFGSTPRRTTTKSRWNEWIEAESRRRLLAASFVLDVHTSMYHEQPLMHSFRSPCPPIPLTRASEELWAAPSPEAWEALLSAGSHSLEPVMLPEETITIDRINSAPPLDRAVFLASEVLRLPKRSIPSALEVSNDPDLTASDRIATLFPGSPIANTYLALHYTPLHDLLAISGESWIFTLKVLPAKKFQQHQRRLKQWSSGLHAAVAARYAARALVAFLDTTANVNYTIPMVAAQGEPSSSAVFTDEQPNHGWNTTNISDYWAMYVSALICWALSHYTTRNNNNSSSASAPASASTGGDNTNKKTTGNHSNAKQRRSEAEALEWLRTVADLRIEDILNPNVRGSRDEINSVITLVKRRLEFEAVGGGGRKSLLVDALGVLRNLEAGVN
ncbi:uncharacterized protein BCR38DRAFT_191230 [Pseudomassariella vexata]|uniref:C2H2-type domain-containing protein n=1 Tax=Pseudomassariella vexata TaxID=1141098 RepID=A0A1Y2E0M9_9PEZI|nr:uncharacterized protein BCR38DRAFT_191230 [Pseudomassariella vexata]ORY65092.1 hypothetical protein BCR38DRAFT_191230 [Pseudomassariella vexata]